MSIFERILEKFLCKHQWKVHETIDVYGDGWGNDTDRPTQTKQTLICDICGKIKRINL